MNHFDRGEDTTNPLSNSQQQNLYIADGRQPSRVCGDFTPTRTLYMKI